MDNANVNLSKIRNVEKPFTELFSLMRRYEVLPDGFSTLAYQTDELKILSQHINNGIDVLLQGLQDMGQLMGLGVQNKRSISDEIKNLGFFISAISNLVEALHALQLDADFVLKQRGND